MTGRRDDRDQGSGRSDGAGVGAGTLGSRVAAAAGWMVAFRWIDRIVGLASVAILARILSPDDFGIVGYATLVIAVLELFTGIATDVELIRHRHADAAYYSAAWTMNILRGLALGALMLALVQPAAEFFREPKLVHVMLVLAAIPVVRGFENVGIVEFRKHLQFDREFKYLLTTRIAGAAVTVALALALRSYWALAAGLVLRTGLGVGLSYAFHPFRPRWTFVRVPEIFRFSRWMMLQTLASGVQDKLPALVVGRAWGSSALAYFSVGREIADLSATEIRAPIRRALYPGLAQIAERRQRVGDVLVESAGMLALLTLPIPLGIALVADDFVPLFLGPQWQPMIDVLRPLCIAASVSALGTNSQLALLALNRSHITAAAASIRLAVLALLLSLAAPHGVVGVAYAIAGMSGVSLAADYALSARALHIAPRRFLGVVWRPVSAALAMGLAVWLLRGGMPPASDLPGHLGSLILSAASGAAVYAGCVLALWAGTGRPEGAERRLLATLQSARMRLRRSPL